MKFSIFPRTIYQTTSKISGEIVVKEQFGQTKLYVQGILQSGGIVKDIWQKAIKEVFKLLANLDNTHLQNGLKTPPRWCCACGTPRRWTEKGKRILILGLGGGTVVQLIKSHRPRAKITSIELDPKIIKIGKKYFGLGEMSNLRTIQADAFEWVATYSNDTYHWSRKLKATKTLRRWRGSDLDSCEVEGAGKGFDLIIIDLYLGKEFPKKAESKKFLENIKELLSKDGLAIFNRLRSREKNLEEFEEKLEMHFSSVEKVKTATNFFFLVTVYTLGRKLSEVSPVKGLVPTGFSSYEVS